MNKTVDFSVFQKLDIRIGTVTEAVVPKWSHWVMKLTVDFGPELKERTCFAGIMHFFKPKDLIGNQFPFVVNLKPRKIGPPEKDGTQGYSEAMLLCASAPLKKPLVIEGEEIQEKPVLLNVSNNVPNGTGVK